MRGKEPTIRPLIEAAVIAAGSAGIGAEAILGQIPHTSLKTIRNVVSRLVVIGTVSAVGLSAERRYFAIQVGKPRVSCGPRTARKGAWTPEQIERLRTEYPITDDSQGLAKELGRTHHGLMMKASELGISRTAAQRKPRQPAKPAKVIKVRPAAPKIARNLGPAYLPGDIDTLPRSPGFRHIVCARKPDPHRTQTFSMFGG